MTRISTDQETKVSEDESTDEIPVDQREALLAIVHGAVVTSSGVSIQRVLLTTIEFVLTQGLGPVLYGVYAFSWRLTQLLVRLVNFGTIQTLQRYIPAYEEHAPRQRAVAGLAYVTTAIAGLVIAGVLMLSAAWLNATTVAHPTFPTTIQLFAVLLVLLGFVQVHAALFRAVGSARGEVVVNRILRPAMRLIGVLGALVLGYSVIGVAGAIVLTTGVLVIAGMPIVITATKIRPTLQETRTEMRQFYNHATPIALSSIGKVFQNRMDIILIGIFLTASAAGVYNVVLVLVSIAWLPLLSFNQLLPPVASELHSAGKTRTLNAVYTAVTRLIVTAVLPIISVQFVFGRELLSIFGPTYSAGYLPLIIYLGGVAVGSAVGATGWLLMMTDHQYARMVLDWFLAIMNIALTYIFVLEFGLAGAALGTSIAICVQNAIQVLLLRRFEQLWPFDRTYFKPLAAAIVMTGVMVTIREIIRGTLAIYIGVISGFLIFIGVLNALGISRHDSLVVREMMTHYHLSSMTFSQCRDRLFLLKRRK